MKFLIFFALCLILAVNGTTVAQKDPVSELEVDLLQFRIDLVRSPASKASKEEVEQKFAEFTAAVQSMQLSATLEHAKTILRSDHVLPGIKSTVWFSISKVIYLSLGHRAQYLAIQALLEGRRASPTSAIDNQLVSFLGPKWTYDRTLGYSQERAQCLSADLVKIANKYGSDKGTEAGQAHNFACFYDKVFQPIRSSVSKVFEIGVREGASLQMWAEFFPNAHAFGIDINRDAVNPYVNNTQGRVHALPCDQSDLVGLSLAVSWADAVSCASSDIQCRGGFTGHPAGGGAWMEPNFTYYVSQRNALRPAEHSRLFDMILDDGSHVVRHQLVSFGFLFPYVKPGGYYVLEDIHTSFMVDPAEGLPYNTTTMHMLTTFVATGKFPENPHIDATALDFIQKHLDPRDVQIFVRPNSWIEDDFYYGANKLISDLPTMQKLQAEYGLHWCVKGCSSTAVMRRKSE